MTAGRPLTRLESSTASRGAMSQRTYGNNLVEKRTYDSTLQPVSITVGTTLLQLALQRKWVVQDLEGRALSLTLRGKREFADSIPDRGDGSPS